MPQDRGVDFFPDKIGENFAITLFLNKNRFRFAHMFRRSSACACILNTIHCSYTAKSCEPIRYIPALSFSLNFEWNNLIHAAY